MSDSRRQDVPGKDKNMSKCNLTLESIVFRKKEHPICLEQLQQQKIVGERFV